MDRRTFLRALAALPLVGSVPALAKYRETAEPVGTEIVPDSERAGSRVEIDLTSRNGGTVKVNGYDLSRVCCGIELVRNVNDFARVKLTLVPKSIRVRVDGADVQQVEAIIPKPE